MGFLGDSAAGLHRDSRALLEGDLRSDPRGDCQSDFPADSHRDSQADLWRESQRDLQEDSQRGFRSDFHSVSRVLPLGLSDSNHRERVRAGVHSVPSAIAVSSVAQCRIQGAPEQPLDRQRN